MVNSFGIDYIWLVPLSPLISFVLISFLFKRLKMLSALTSVIGLLVSFGMTLDIIRTIVTTNLITMKNPIEKSITWLDMNGLFIEMGALIDPLTAVMLFVVTFISLLVAIYSIGYMKDDPYFSRFFGYVSLFVFSMLGLVISNNYFQTFVFWELVGLSSYLLIGFYFYKDSAAKACDKAFNTNRVADFGFMLGIILLFLHFGTFNFGQLAGSIASSTDLAFLTLAAILVFIGPVGKSGQFPLHVWLPDAMEGPTPCSALIHAATMVAAGVYLLARGFILFASVEQVMTIIAYVGGFTAIFAATIAITQRDLKRILAYSTLSQLGYMVMAIGIGSMTAGMFHLTTHAFFKALMFLCAGSVIHAIHKQDIFEMGGIFKEMKITTITMVIGGLAIAGIPPFAGFWSKDEILLACQINGFPVLYVVASFTAFLTAFYMFRMIFLAFFGEKRSEFTAHESPLSMTVPLMILAFFSIVGGFIGAPFIEKGFASYIYVNHVHHPVPNYMIMGSSTIIATLGILLAYLMYIKKIISADAIATRFKPIYNLLYNKYYIDEFYGWVFNNLVLGFAALCNWLDRNIVDGTAHFIAWIIRTIGAKGRYVHTGSLQTYGLVIFAAIIVIVLFLAGPVIGGVQ
ncbi:NADH dehydrogenase subunit L [Desulfonispora thiosulfatigenes DSM 11270]|uniref:NADH dehydrogenase subunit L n=1 Tax=Desulfonispora thiosulfatigenes DSM 11270 TaxID=656914 RepID=A0A1W1VKM7_DESTI|nr:NADH-quinone oxidoreductase subunit L [Desulfonispora thiosulfatigenes]SMB93917.1 NADH dehydrogenase subunit L [Desulfonispora thiosulfatigenes DSM 11270]